MRAENVKANDILRSICVIDPSHIYHTTFNDSLISLEYLYGHNEIKQTNENKKM